MLHILPILPKYNQVSKCFTSILEVEIIRLMKMIIARSTIKDKRTVKITSGRDIFVKMKVSSEIGQKSGISNKQII